MTIQHPCLVHEASINYNHKRRIIVAKQVGGIELLLALSTSHSIFQTLYLLWQKDAPIVLHMVLIGD